MSLTLRGTEGASPGLFLGTLNVVNLALAVGLAQAATPGLHYAQGIPVSSSPEQLTRLTDSILRGFLSSKLGNAVSAELLPRVLANRDDAPQGRTVPFRAAGSGAACSNEESPALAVAAASFLLFWFLHQAQQASRNMPPETSGSPSLEAVIHWAAGVLSTPVHTDIPGEDQGSPLPCVAAQVLLAVLLRFSPAPRTKARGDFAAETEPKMLPPTVTCLLFSLQNAACSEDARIRTTALLAICLVISWGNDQSSMLACSPWTQYLFEIECLWGDSPAKEGEGILGASVVSEGHPGKWTVRRCMASLVDSISRHGFGLRIPHRVSRLEKPESEGRAPGVPGMKLHGGLEITSPNSQVLTAVLVHLCLPQACML